MPCGLMVRYRRDDNEPETVAVESDAQSTESAAEDDAEEEEEEEEEDDDSSTAVSVFLMIVSFFLLRQFSNPINSFSCLLPAC